MNKLIAPYIEEACEKITSTYTFGCGCKETYSVTDIIKSFGRKVVCQERHIKSENNIIEYEIGENL